jgi:hypothetical protein
VNKYQYTIDNCCGKAPRPMVKPKPLTGIQKMAQESKLDAIQVEYLKEFGGER